MQRLRVAGYVMKNLTAIGLKVQLAEDGRIETAILSWLTIKSTAIQIQGVMIDNNYRGTYFDIAVKACPFIHSKK